jgi:hypothetical protein
VAAVVTAGVAPVVADIAPGREDVARRVAAEPMPASYCCRSEGKVGQHQENQSDSAKHTRPR